MPADSFDLEMYVYCHLTFMPTDIKTPHRREDNWSGGGGDHCKVVTTYYQVSAS